MFTIWCHGNLALDGLQLVLIVSRAPCFGVEPLKVAALPILQSLCCLHPALVHSLVHTALVQTVLVHCRGGGRGGLQAFSGSPQIHSKCLPHSQPHCQPPLSGLHTFSMPATRLSQSDPHLTLSIFAPRLTWSHVSLTWRAPLPLIYTLCSASMCAPICHQAGALSMALVARLFRLTALGCGSFQRLRCIFFSYFLFW